MKKPYYDIYVRMGRGEKFWLLCEYDDVNVANDYAWNTAPRIYGGTENVKIIIVYK